MRSLSADLQGATLSGANLTNADLWGADLTGTVGMEDFTGALVCDTAYYSAIRSNIFLASA